MKLVQQTMPSVAEPANGRREFLRGTAAAGIGALMALVPLHKDYDSFVGCALMLAGSG